MMNKFRSQQGSILPITIVFIIVSTSLVFAYFKWAQTKRFTLNRRVAQVKAYYNAESGLAESAFKALVSKQFTQIDSTLDGRRLDNIPPHLYHQSQGSYTGVDLTQGLNDQYTVQRMAVAEGEAHIRTVNGELKPIHATATMAFDQASLAEYMYLTQSELAGGHPFVFNGVADRREVTFGVGDAMGGGNIQTNGQFVMSDFGCPQFHHTVWLTYGQPLPNMGTCNYSQVFLGEPDTLSRPAVKLPPSGYYTTKSAARHVYDSTEKLNWMFPIHRDSLIMTELVFNRDGFRVRRWWFLKPPHFEQNGGLPIIFPIASMHLDWDDYGGYDSDLCVNTADVRSCLPYQEDLWKYHARFGMYDNLDYFENFADNTINYSHGLFHYDYPRLNAIDGDPNGPFLTDEVVFDNGPSVIYVKGGPVLVRGQFNGRFTVVTDEFQLYRRHAWNNNVDPPLDTLWCNIWLTGDLTNVEAGPSGNLGGLQPIEDCSQGSNNIMGLVSGANVFVANTPQNRSAINVNAAIVAFNESFAMHYCQNTCTTNAGGQDPFGNPIRYCDPPYADGRGPDIYGSTGNQDYRGYITLWGGIVQKYRGYMMRNQPGPYNTGDIGMDKDYHYDRNLSCGPPPYYPSIEFDTEEVSVNLVQYGVSE